VNRIVVFYRTETGKCPIEEFLDSVQGKSVQKITWVLKLLEDLIFIPKQYFKKLSGTDGI